MTKRKSKSQGKSKATTKSQSKWTKLRSFVNEHRIGTLCGIVVAVTSIVGLIVLIQQTAFTAKQLAVAQEAISPHFQFDPDFALLADKGQPHAPVLVVTNTGAAIRKLKGYCFPYLEVFVAPGRQKRIKLAPCFLYSPHGDRADRGELNFYLYSQLVGPAEGVFAKVCSQLSKEKGGRGCALKTYVEITYQDSVGEDRMEHYVLDFSSGKSAYRVKEVPTMDYTIDMAPFMVNIEDRKTSINIEAAAAAIGEKVKEAMR